jgi:hypothetical protein
MILTGLHVLQIFQANARTDSDFPTNTLHFMLTSSFVFVCRCRRTWGLAVPGPLASTDDCDFCFHGVNKFY